MTDIAFDSASALAAAIAARRIGSRELLEHYLARVERHNPALNAIVTLDVERARDRAAAADAALARGESWGPLHGLPMTIKDSIEVGGLRTTSGSPLLAQYVSRTDAPTVARLRAAGAVIFGKTNLPVFAGDVQSYNPVFGTTNNPWDLTRTPGGSSGGAAAALAAGLTGLELGSDIGGSIRNPAHCCGVFGHKPSHGIVPGRGHIPGPPGTLSEADIAVLGPLARSADDLGLALRLLAGPDRDRAVGWKLALPPPRRNTLREFRVAAWFDDPACRIDSELLARYQALAETLRREGVAVDEAARPAVDFGQAIAAYVNLLLPIVNAGLPDADFRQLAALADALPPDDPSPMGAIARATALRHRDWLRINEARTRMRAAWTTFFEKFDVLLCPVLPTAAILHDHSEPMSARSIQVNGTSRPYLEQTYWAGLTGMAWLPATVAPIGLTAAGLPIGVQIVGPWLEDFTPIAFAGHLAALTGGFRPPPGY